MSINIAIINVGVNRKFFDKYHLLSPLFEDGSFEYVPVPEAAYPTCPGLPTYRELFSNKERVLQTIPEETRDLKVHYDPEFESFTYGDNPHLKEGRGRANKLLGLKKFDILLFFVRLTEIKNGKPTSKAAPFFIGYFEVDQIEPSVTITSISEDLLRTYGKNAHIIRGRYDSTYFNGFWVCRGSSNSSYFKQAVPFDREITERIVMLDAKGNKFAWSQEPSYFRIQQGGRTRPCRFVDGGNAGKEALLRHVLKFNKIPLFQHILSTLSIS